MNSNINIENNLINNSYKNYLIVIILGYYGVKIVFSYFFKMYTNKYYDANILLNTTDSSGNNALKNIVINSYFPYTSNNDFSDFTILIILTFILYIFTENFVKSILSFSKRERPLAVRYRTSTCSVAFALIASRTNCAPSAT